MVVTTGVSSTSLCSVHVEKMCSGVLPGQPETPGSAISQARPIPVSPLSKATSTKSIRSGDGKGVLENLRKLQGDEHKDEKKQVIDALQGKSVKTGRRSSVSEMRLIEQMQVQGEKKRLFLYNVVRSQRFDAAIGVVILLNSITIGLESSFELASYDTTVFQVLESFFLCIYVGELGIRFYAQRWACLASGWVRFDVVLVGLGVLTTWIMDPVVAIMTAAGGSEIPGIKDGMAPIMVLRVLRLFRLARALRLLVQFRTLWMLVRGLLTSAGTICYTFVLIFMLLYIASCLIIELITKPGRDSSDEETRQMVTDYWSNIWHIMLTLIQFVTFDSIGSIYVPMINKNPVLVFFFVPFLLIVSVALMNLVTAVIVEGAIEQSKQDKDVQAEYKRAEIKKLLPSLTEMFHELDIDGNGTLSLDEITESNDDLKEQLMQFLNAENLTELFDMIDVDGSGEVNIDEFCEGISKLASSETPVEFIRILKQLGTLRQGQQQMRGQMSEVAEAQRRIEWRLEEIERANERRSEEFLLRMEGMLTSAFPFEMRHSQPGSKRPSKASEAKSSDDV